MKQAKRKKRLELKNGEEIQWEESEGDQEKRNFVGGGRVFE